jgi:hypothetical protein
VGRAGAWKKRRGGGPRAGTTHAIEARQVLAAERAQECLVLHVEHDEVVDLVLAGRGHGPPFESSERSGSFCRRQGVDRVAQRVCRRHTLLLSAQRGPCRARGGERQGHW